MQNNSCNRVCEAIRLIRNKEFVPDGQAKRVSGQVAGQKEMF